MQITPETAKQAIVLCFALMIILFCLNFLLLDLIRRKIEAQFPASEKKPCLHWQEIALLANNFESAIETEQYLKRGGTLPIQGPSMVLQTICGQKEKMRANLLEDNFYYTRSENSKIILPLLLPLTGIIAVTYVGFGVLRSFFDMQSKYASTSGQMMLCIIALQALFMIYVYRSGITNKARRILREMRQENQKLLNDATCCPEELKPEEMGLAVALFGKRALTHQSFEELKNYLYPHQGGGGG